MNSRSQSPPCLSAQINRRAWLGCFVSCVRHRLARKSSIIFAKAITGDIEQRQRRAGDLTFHSVGFVARSIERMPKPLEG